MISGLLSFYIMVIKLYLYTFNYSISCMANIESSSVDHIIRLIKQKFISPQKIIFMVDQKQADHFKARNKNMGCCTASQITIPSAEQTKLQKILAQLITSPAIRNDLQQILQYCEDRFKNISEKGKQDKLKITKDVQKYLIDNILSEYINTYIYKKLKKIISKQAASRSTQIGLWATPSTWFAKFPNIKLELFEPKNLAQLFNQDMTILSNKFQPYLKGAFLNLELLQKDGRFQQVNSLSNPTHKQTSNQTKVLTNLALYVNLEGENQNFIQLSKLYLLLQSIPFELNMKANSYLTANETTQIFYYSQPPFYKTQKINECKYQVILCLNSDLKIQYGSNKINLKTGNLGIFQTSKEFSFNSQNLNRGKIYIIKSFICEASKQK